MGQELLYGVGIVVLAAALIYGMRQSRTKNRAAAKVGEDVTKERYRNNET
jgi:hypothetical protein